MTDSKADDDEIGPPIEIPNFFPDNRKEYEKMGFDRRVSVIEMACPCCQLPIRIEFGCIDEK